MTVKVAIKGGTPLAKRADHAWYRVSSPAWAFPELVYARSAERVRSTFWSDRASLTVERTDLTYAQGLREVTGELNEWGRKVEAEERERQAQPKHPRAAEVTEWLRGYEGRNSFVLDVQAKFLVGRSGGRSKAYRLTERQVEALANVKDREAERAKARAEQPKSGLNLWAAMPYGTTYAAAENERGGLSFVRIDKVEHGKWADWVFVKAVLGDNEDHRLGAQRPSEDDYSGQWVTVLRNVAADPVGAVARYGLELGVCGVCHRQLTNEESRAGGIGPVCRAKMAGG